MKHFKTYLFLVLLGASITACSTSDDSNDNGDEENTAELILGTWQFSFSTTNGQTDPVDDPCEDQITLTFNADGDFFRFERSGDQCQTTTQYTGNYTLSGNNITVTTAQGTIMAEIITLNSNTLSFRTSDDGDVYIETFTR